MAHGNPWLNESWVVQAEKPRANPEDLRVGAPLAPMEKLLAEAVPSVTGDADMDKLLAECLDVMARKGAEYVNGSPDRLANFRGAGADCGVTPQQAWYVFFNKHVRAIANYVRTGTVASDEPIRGRIKDAIVYLLLFGKMVAETERPKAVGK